MNYAGNPATLSRVIDFDNWSVCASFFEYIIYLFSDLSRLIGSRLQIQPSVPCPGDVSVAAFSVDWVRENN